MQSLFLIAIGPVQEFISTARRSRDLWFGSWLLSELSKVAALEIVNQNGPDSLIFPSIDKDNLSDLEVGSGFSVVNKIVAIIQQPPADLGQLVYQEMLQRLRSIRQDAYHPRLTGSPHFLEEVARRQVDDLIEYYWSAVPISDFHSAKAYADARTLGEALLVARKATRNFEQVTWGKPVPKSSLDGFRESVINESAYPQRGDTQEQVREKIRQLHIRYGVRNGERLCGVGLLKRHGNRGNDDSFFSTSHVAALPLISRLKESNAGMIEEYIRVIQQDCHLSQEEVQLAVGKVPRSVNPVFGHYDGHLLFAERLPELIGEDENGKGEEKQADVGTAKRALRRFLDSAFGKGVQPLPYYALLLADGDRMGKAIDAQAQKGIESHRNLSKQLSAFARKVKEIVEAEHQGSLVYSGGDDVLAFVPLHTVLPCAHRLATVFHSQLSTFQFVKDNEPASPTLSVGIAISHHLEPLTDALQLARAAEKAAKRDGGRDALAITLSKRSGIDRTVVGKWGEFVPRLSRFITLHRLEAIPDGAAYELRELSTQLKTMPDAMRAEAIRILERKRAARGKEAIAKDERQKLASDISQAVASRADRGLAQLADEIIIARIFADAMKQAGMEPEVLSRMFDQAISEGKP